MGHQQELRSLGSLAHCLPGEFDVEESGREGVGKEQRERSKKELKSS